MKIKQVETGFTLIELLVVMAIIGILAGMIFAAVLQAKNKAREAKAKAEITLIENAVKSYYTEYGKFPHGNGNTADYNYGASLSPGPAYANNRDLMNVLRSLDGVGNGSYTNNPRRIVYLDISAKSIDVNGNFLDPWDNQYEITIDVGYDNVCNNMAASYPNVTNKNIVIWSQGSNKTPDPTSTGSDVRSWK